MSNDNVRARNRGKAWERRVAEILGGFRPRGGNRGMAGSDVGGVPWAIECTRTAQMWRRLRPKWEQASVNAEREGKEPVLIAARPRQRWQDALVVMLLELFQSLTRGDEDA